jgi:hypothetical protein
MRVTCGVFVIKLLGFSGSFLKKLGQRTFTQHQNEILISTIILGANSKILANFPAFNSLVKYSGIPLFGLELPFCLVFKNLEAFDISSSNSLADNSETQFSISISSPLHSLEAEENASHGR